VTTASLNTAERTGVLLTIALVTVTVTIALTAQVLTPSAVADIRAIGSVVAFVLWLGSLFAVMLATHDQRQAVGAAQRAVARRDVAQSIYRCIADGLLTAFLVILYLMPKSRERVFFSTHPLLAYSLIFAAIILLVVNEGVEVWWRRLFVAQFTEPVERIE